MRAGLPRKLVVTNSNTVSAAAVPLRKPTPGRRTEDKNVHLAGLEFCAHVGIDFAAENNFFENRAGPGHDCHLLPRILTAGTPEEPDLNLENDTTPLVALNPRIDGTVWHRWAISRSLRPLKPTSIGPPGATGAHGPGSRGLPKPPMRGPASPTTSSELWIDGHKVTQNLKATVALTAGSHTATFVVIDSFDNTASSSVSFRAN